MSAIAPAVIITIPKYVAISPNNLPKLQPAIKANTVNTQLLHEDMAGESRAESPFSSGYSSCDGTTPKTKKRRLDHLTWEEKIQRKKLKNRVAAQTSRDRKKARMEEMEQEIKELNENSEILSNKCDSLMSINDTLLEKNRKLEIEVEALRQQVQEIKQQKQEAKTCASCESLTLIGSAVSKSTNPLQQGSLKMGQKETQLPQVAALWRIVALCLLYKTCSSSMTSRTSMKKTSMPAGWKNLQKAFLPISQQTWKQAIERAVKLLPKLQASQSDCLDQWWGPQQCAWNPTDMMKEKITHPQHQNLMPQQEVVA